MICGSNPFTLCKSFAYRLFIGGHSTFYQLRTGDSHIYLNMWFSEHHHVVFEDQRWWINSYLNGIIACKLNGKNKLFPFCIWFKFVIFLPVDLFFISIKQKLKFFQHIFSWKNKLREFIAPHFFKIYVAVLDMPNGSMVLRNSNAFPFGFHNELN